MPLQSRPRGWLECIRRGERRSILIRAKPGARKSLGCLRKWNRLSRAGGVRGQSWGMVRGCCWRVQTIRQMGRGKEECHVPFRILGSEGPISREEYLRDRLPWKKFPFLIPAQRQSAKHVCAYVCAHACMCMLAGRGGRGGKGKEEA